MNEWEWMLNISSEINSGAKGSVRSTGKDKGSL